MTPSRKRSAIPQGRGKSGPGRVPKTPSSVVGIGASAGGLEALQRFFARVPGDSDLAFVVVQHLDPTHRGLLTELLQRCTSLKVVQVKDRMKVERGRIHVIPPNKDLSIFHGRLHLFAPTARRGLRLPIDFFFRSLAADRGHRSVGVILSGMGSDGSMGLRSVKEQGGVIFVQRPEDAKYDAMPRHVIDAGLADVVAPADILADKVLDFCARSARTGLPGHLMGDKTQGALEKICALLRNQTGNDFSQYKKSTLHRRVERRMDIQRVADLEQYVRLLRSEPREVTALFKELLIGVTRFFRDPEAWEHLGRKVLPSMLAKLPPGTVIRAWVPACSTGEEAYSLAMVVKEAIEKNAAGKGLTLQVFGTDLDREAVERARAGIYPPNIATDIPVARLERFFVKEKHGYRVGREIRESVIFAPQNLIVDPPFTKLDLLSCRNLFIYLESSLQRRLLSLFHYALKPNGVLFLGSAETAGNAVELFAPMGGRVRFYRRLPNDTRSGLDAFALNMPHTPPPRGPAAGAMGRKGRKTLGKRKGSRGGGPAQAAQEDLQSTNEELTSSKEEMQSLNEELQTLNHELQIKIDLLTRTNDDMRNLIDATDLAMVFLDRSMRLRRFTVPMTRILKLVPGDIGRPITDFGSELVFPGLVTDAREVLRRHLAKETLVESRDGRRVLVRIVPYRRIDRKVDGVVLIFTGIEAARKPGKSLVGG